MDWIPYKHILFNYITTCLELFVFHDVVIHNAIFWYVRST